MSSPDSGAGGGGSEAGSGDAGGGGGSVPSTRRHKPSGILRLDLSVKPRRSSVEFRNLGQPVPASPQPSIDRLSVTFAPEEKSICSDTSVKVQISTPEPSPTVTTGMDRLRSPRSSDVGMGGPTAPDAGSEDEDYSASVNAIIMRRASTRKSRGRPSRRRASSPFSPDADSLFSAGRRASVFTTSSGDTAVSIDEAPCSEEINERLKLHQEVLGAVRTQPWPMRRKLRLVRTAKAYVRRHEGALKQRLAESRNTRDLVQRYKLLIAKRLQYLHRETVNIFDYLTPWEQRIKQIESHFGSAVASYFTFLRWLFWINLVITVVIVAFVTIPEVLTADWSQSGGRKTMSDEEKMKSQNLMSWWNLEGILKYSPLFYGYYTNKNNSTGYRLPLAYFITELVIYVYSFVAILKKMAQNSRMSKLSEKDDECVFTWKLFTGWDYIIGNPETAQNRVSSLILGFKEALLEEAEKKREDRNWKIITSRIFVNITVLLLLLSSAYVVYRLVERSNEPASKSNWWRQNEISIIMSLITLVFPMFFEGLGLLEQYHPRTQLRLQLTRIMVLNLINLYSLILSQFGNIDKMTEELNELKKSYNIDIESTNIVPVTESDSNEIFRTMCINFTVNCNATEDNNITATMITLLVTNATLLTGLISNTTQQIPDLSTYFSTSNYSDYDFSTINYSDNDISTTDLTNYTFNLENTTDYLNYTVTTLSNFNESEPYDPLLGFIDLFPLNLTVYDENDTFVTESTNQSNFETNDVPSEKSITKRSAEKYLDTVKFMSTNKPIVGEKLNSKMCYEILCNNGTKTNKDIVKEVKVKSISKRNRTVNMLNDKKLRDLCWETKIGREFVKLTVMDLILTTLFTLIFDFFRGLFVRYMNNCWCWDLEKNFPMYGEFKIAENILYLINNQGMVWMGLFFSPGLAFINLIILVIVMYIRSWTVMTCNVPHEVVFRASRSNNFYLALLLVMLFLCVLPVGYVMVWVEPSWHCGPFSGCPRISKMFTQALHEALPTELHRGLDYMASPGIVIPLLVLLILIIYYLMSLTNALRESNHDLKIQLHRERTEERRKMFQIADRRWEQQSGEIEKTPFQRWKKILPVIPASKAFDLENINILKNNRASLKENQKLEVNKNRTPLLLRDDNVFSQETDTELHDSLPDDSREIKTIVSQIRLKEIVHEISCTKTKDSSNPNSKNKTKTHKHKSKEVDSKITRQESQISENIPVITISKTESSESILEAKDYEEIKNEERQCYSEKLDQVKIVSEVLKNPSIESTKSKKQDDRISQTVSEDQVSERTKTESSCDYKDLSGVAPGKSSFES